jgi:hypothetical protein
MFDAPEEMPNAHMIPHEPLRAKYGDYFFTSSLAWMAAMAIEAILGSARKGDTGPHAMGFWGVDMAACPSPETRVLTADLRWVPAGDLRVGDKIIAFDEETTPGVGGDPGKRMWRTAEVLRADPITKPCHRVFLEDDREIVCSSEHKWLTYAENQCRWKETRDLVTPQHRPGRPTRIVKVCDTWEEDRSWDAGYLAAAFDGEGHLSQKLREGDYGMLRAGFAQRANPMSEKVLDACKHMGFELGLDARDGGVNGDCYKFSIKGGRTKTMEFLGRIRPRRLMGKFDPENLGVMQKTGTVAVTSIEDIGEQPVVGLTTSTGTFVAEGLASHNTEEYGYQRAGCQFFAQIAESIGIQVVVPKESDLMTPPPLYGLSERTHRGVKLTSRKAEIDNRLKLAQNKKAVAEQEVSFLTGASDDLDYHMKMWNFDGTPNKAQFGPIFATPQEAPDPEETE